MLSKPVSNAYCYGRYVIGFNISVTGSQLQRLDCVVLYIEVTVGSKKTLFVNCVLFFVEKVLRRHLEVGVKKKIAREGYTPRIFASARTASLQNKLYDFSNSISNLSQKSIPQLSRPLQAVFRFWLFPSIRVPVLLCFGFDSWRRCR